MLYFLLIRPPPRCTRPSTLFPYPTLVRSQASPCAFDGLLVVLLISALVADMVALAAIAARISEFGSTPNRVAALGENVILLVNLGWSAALYLRFLRGRDRKSTRLNSSH